MMAKNIRILMRGFFFLFWLLLPVKAWATYSRPWQLYFQDPATPVMEDIQFFHNILLITEGFIVLVVAALLLFVIVRFRASKNKVPSKTAHHTLIEVIWTLIPVLILIVIAFPSFKLLYMMETVPKADFTIKAIGNQWYWTYEYPDHAIRFDSHMISTDQLKPGQLRLLEVDNRVVVPTHTTIRLLTTSSDVIHSWAVPAFGVKKDSIPGRLNETWFYVTKEGVYYGQCSELCGVKHGFMPIVVEAVPKAQFEQWIALKKETQK